MEFKDSKTRENLMTAFLRESGAYNEYTFYAQQATKDGFESIYNLFNQFATNEQAHAKIWFKLWHGISCTQDNLIDSADLEKYEHSVLYKEFSKVANDEGFEDIALLFEQVGKIESRHEKEYKELFEKVKKETIFVEKEEVAWKCLNCGHMHKGKQPPEICPVCSHPKAYFEVACEEK